MLYLSMHRVDKLNWVKKELHSKETGKRVKFAGRQAQYLTRIVVGEGCWLAGSSRSFTKRLMKVMLHLHPLNEVRNNIKQAFEVTLLLFFRSSTGQSGNFTALLSRPFMHRGLALKMGGQKEKKKKREKNYTACFQWPLPYSVIEDLICPFILGLLECNSLVALALRFWVAATFRADFWDGIQVSQDLLQANKGNRQRIWWLCLFFLMFWVCFFCAMTQV